MNCELAELCKMIDQKFKKPSEKLIQNWKVYEKDYKGQIQEMQSGLNEIKIELKGIKRKG